MVDSGVPIDTDLNTYDSFHESMPHPKMKNGAWTQAYRDAWDRFYSLDHMKEVLSKVDAKNYWDIFRNYVWCKNSFYNDGAHPMISGFFRFKDRKTRRATFPRESRWAHLKRRIPELYQYAHGAVRLIMEMEELWLQTRKRSETEIRVVEELARMRASLQRGLRISDLRLAYARVKAQVPTIEIPSRFSLLREKVSVLRVSRLRETREDLSKYWMTVRQRVRRGRLEVLLRVDRMAINLFREFRLAAGFFIALSTGAN
jgi:hypothetical protein